MCNLNSISEILSNCMWGSKKCTVLDSNNINSRLLCLFRQISKYLKVARKANEEQIVSTRIIMEGGEFPWQHSFPPFFTLQPHQETQRKQLDAWQTIVLGKFEISKPYRIHFPTSKIMILTLNVMYI